MSMDGERITNAYVDTVEWAIAQGWSIDRALSYAEGWVDAIKFFNLPLTNNLAQT